MKRLRNSRECSMNGTGWRSSRFLIDLLTQLKIDLTQLKIDFDSNFRLHENGTVTITRTHRPVSDEHREQLQINGKVVKKYRIDSARYRKIVSSSINLYRNKVNKIVFLTLTFPGSIDEFEANKCFSKFIDNLKATYGLKNYIAVKEFTLNGVPHYHVLADFPFFDIRRINGAWCNTFPINIPGSRNAVRLPKNHKSIVKDLHRCVKYLCKYFVKSRDLEYLSRCSFISHEICSQPADIDYQDAEKLINKYKHKVYHYRYCSVIYLNDVLQDYELIEKLFSEYRELQEPP